MKSNILISSAGRRVSLLRAFKSELKKIFPSSKVLGCDAFPSYSAACANADFSFQIPKINDPRFITELLEKSLEHEVGIIIPTIDTELLLLSKNKKLFEENGIKIIVSDEAFVTICRNKILTHQFFMDNNIDVAKEVDRHQPVFPLFIKPADGSSSVNIHIVKQASQLNSDLIENKNLMFLEYLDKNEHTEFTLDLYYDKKHTLKCAVPRQRIETRSGEVSKGITRKNFLLNFVINKLKLIRGAIGCITLQLFVNDKTQAVTGIEINPRFGGGYPLSYRAGANYPAWVIKEYLLNESLAYSDNWEENLLMLRYDDEILVHGFKD